MTDRNDRDGDLQNLVPTDEATVPVKLTYAFCAEMPIGAVVADAGGYWSAMRRHYVKTTRNTWAVFFHLPTRQEVNEVVKEGRNNLSPCPHWLAFVVSPHPVEAQS